MDSRPNRLAWYFDRMAAKKSNTETTTRKISVLDGEFDPKSTREQIAFAENIREFVRKEMKRTRLKFTAITKHLGINRQTLHRWCKSGLESRSKEFDRFCRRFGIVPTSVWDPKGYRRLEGFKEPVDYHEISTAFDEWIESNPPREAVEQITSELRRLTK